MPDPIPAFNEQFEVLLGTIESQLPKDVQGRLNVVEQQVETEFSENESLLEDLADAMGQHRREIEQAILGEWKEALRWMDIAIGYLRFQMSTMPSGNSGPRVQNLVFAELGSRAVSVSQEVLVLLQGGFPLGARARWRALYETAIYVQVLALGNRGTAARYRNHAYVRLHRDFAGYVPETPEEEQFVTETQRKQASFVRRYGTSFRGTYGWAAELTRRKLNVEKPKFWHLEKMAELSRLHDIYVSSHHDVHADPIGTARLRNSQGLLHSGASLSSPSLLAAATIDCLMAIARTIADAWYDHYDGGGLRYLAMAALADEIKLTGLRATQSSSHPRLQS